MLNFIFNLSAKKSVYRILLLILIIDIVWFNFYGVKFNFDISKNSLDLRFGYTSEEVSYYFNYLGEGGRADYKYAMSIIDMMFPLVYGMLLILQVASIVKKLYNANTVLLFILILLPVGTIVFDYLENLNTLKMLVAYPEIKDDLVTKGSFFTQTKWLFSSLTITFITIGFIKVRQEKKKLKKQC